MAPIDAASMWPADDPGRVLLHALVETSVDTLFEDLFGARSPLQVRVRLCALLCAPGGERGAATPRNAFASVPKRPPSSASHGLAFM